MAIISDHNRADECAILLRVLLDAKDDGLSIDEIQKATGWENARVHHRLLDLGSKVAHHNLKTPEKLKVTHYYLKVK